jgi:hypothetical protein
MADDPLRQRRTEQAGALSGIAARLTPLRHARLPVFRDQPRRPVGAARTPFSRSPPSPRMRPDDLDGGTGVPEPRWSSPSMPALALELDIPEAQYLEMSTQPA